jgi:cytochrome b pre-mRNA-processing protein 3
MVLSTLFRRNSHQEPARRLYLTVVEQARRPEFYRDHGVPDTVDGRFDLIALHAFMVLHRLQRDHPDSADLAQALFDIMFLDMDQSLREMGVGDLGVGRRIKDMVRGLYGRVAAYQEGLAAPGRGLQAALGRNLYGTVEADPAWLDDMAAYVRREVEALARQSLESLMAGSLSFGPPPGPARAAR